MLRDGTRKNSRQRWSPRSLSATRLFRMKVCIVSPLRVLTLVRLVRVWLASRQTGRHRPTATGSCGRSLACSPGSAELTDIHQHGSPSCVSGVVDTADDPLVHPIANRLPKVHGPGVFLLHQRCDALGPLPNQPLF